MTAALPDPRTVPDAAADAATATADRVDDPGAVNVLVADRGAPGDRDLAAVDATVADRVGDVDRASGVDRVGDVDRAGVDRASGVDRADGAYEGPDAGTVGRLAAAAAALSDAPGGCLHYPDPDVSAPGPWLVVEPLAGRLATVARGRATVTVEVGTPDGHLDARLRTCRDRLDALLEAARPRHDTYPLDRDERAVFTRGLAAVELAGVATEPFTVTFDVRTTPATSTADLRARFADVAGVERTTVAVEHGVERAAPPAGLRAAAEAAAAATVGDWEYEWLPGPTAFCAVPGGGKLALGTGEPGADRFDAAAYAACRDLLRETLAAGDGGEPSAAAGADP